LEDLGNYENLHILKYQFNPVKKLTVGNSVPDFEFSLIDSSDKIISKKSLKGKYYLIDFWATWSPTSMTELPKLHQLFEKYKTKRGFTIVSLSFDNKEETVLRFKKEYKYSMPWLHGFIKTGFNNKLAELFEVGSIPKRILVDEFGNVVAINDELRGLNLEQTLKKHLE
jgi:thiol-disulfide isomerase/thioredoxin